MSLGHTLKTGSNAVYGCHELEVYPADRLTCASGNTLIKLDMSGAFNDRGTPNDFTDDKPRGTPLPCRVRAQLDRRPVHHRRQGDRLRRRPAASGTEDLTVPAWLESGAPSLQGVRWLGSIYHQGRGAGGAGDARLRLHPGHRLQPRGRAERAPAAC